MPLSIELTSARPASATAKTPLSKGLDLFRLHPLRERLYSELHNRPFHPLASPAQLSHIAIQHGGKLREEEHRYISALCNRFQVASPAESMPCFHQHFGLFSLRWERHLEYSTYTFIHEAPLTAAPFLKNGIDYVPDDWLAQMPGEVIAALHLVTEPAAAEESRVAEHFDNMRLVGSAPMQGAARVWTTFKVHGDGFGRFLVFDQELSPSQRGRLVQRLLELDTYRLMATLGLPTAQEINAELTRLDLQLKQLTARIAEVGEGGGDRLLLVEVSAMQALIEDYRAQSNYRFAATQAYYDVILQRMQELRESEIGGHLTLKEFLMRRITPAVKTCQAVSARLEDLSRRVSRASDLLRTRVEMVLQEQNQELLMSMNRRAKVQLRLQQTVEGLSVAAISYYGIQLLEQVMVPLQAAGLTFDPDVVLGVAVPVLIGSVFIGTRLIHRRLLREV